MKKIYTLIFVLVFGMVNIQAQELKTTQGNLATLNGVKLYYEESGEGPPLILLHSFGSTSSSWESLIPELAKKNRVIAIDLPGHGKSDYIDTTEVYLHKKVAEYVLEFIDYLNLDSVNVIGASSGAFIALYMATMKPERTKRIVVIGGQIYYSQQTRDIITNCCGKGPDDKAISMHGEEKAAILDRQFYYFRKLYGDPSFTPDLLATIQAKSLIIHGDNDGIAPMSNAWEMNQYIPKSSLWIIPDGGHLPHLRPENKEIFISRIFEFFNGNWD